MGLYTKLIEEKNGKPATMQLKMAKNLKIIINKEDVIPYIYFVCSLAQRGKMYGGLSGKSDYIGGIFDRWINIIPESVIFNKYFLPKIAKNLSVISDYYEYDPKKSGIAPDVLGVKVDKDVKPFVEYVDKWQALDIAPQIEVKSFKKAQYMVSLRNQGYDKKYLVMVEINLDSDYLLPFFKQTVISGDVYNKLKMDDSIFIKSNINKDLSSITKINRQSTDLGSLRLIIVCSAKDFMSFSTLCSANESPFYIKEINETRTAKNIPPTTLFSDYLSQNNNNLHSWNNNLLDKNNKHKMLDVYVNNLENINFVKNSKSSITIYTKGKATINDTDLEAKKTYIIKFQILDRSSNNGEEYFMHKSIIDKIPSKEEDMLNDIKKQIK